MDGSEKLASHEQGLDGRRVAVIGCGLAGLTAALKLKELGANVTVFEKDREPGGRAKTVSKDGFELNLGPHALYTAGATYQLLAGMGMAPSGRPPSFAKAIAIFDGRSFTLPFSLNGILACGYLSWRDKVELMRLMLTITRLDTSQIMSVSLADWCVWVGGADRVRKTVASFVRLSTYSNNPLQMSAGAAFEQLRLAQKGVLYLDRGWRVMVESFQKNPQTHPTHRFGSHVESISSGSEGVKVLADNEQMCWVCLVLWVPPEQVNKLIPGAVSLEEMAKIIPSRAACLDVCLKRLPDPSCSFALGIDEPLYYSVHSNAAQLAPASGALIHTAYYLSDTNSAVDYEKRLEAMLDSLQPGWRAEIVYKRFLPHMVASFGTPLAKLDGASGLDSPVRANHKNVYICGDFVGRSAQLADAAVSSVLTSVNEFRLRLNDGKARDLVRQM